MPKYTLMQHQIDGVKFLDDMEGVGALLFEPGTGKTGTTLTWIDRLARRIGEVRVLVVAPLTAADTWVLQAPPFMDSVVKARMLQGSTVSILDKIRVAGDWTKVPDMPISVDHPGTRRSQVSGNRVTILSMSAGAISSYARDNTQRVKMLQAIRRYSPHVVVVDESHIIKSANAHISKAMYQIGQLAPHRIILTGTVNPHSPLDCYGQWRFMAPWTFSDSYGESFTDSPSTMTKAQAASIRPWPWGKFEKRYAEHGGYKGKQITGVDPVTIKELHDRVSERAMVVLKKDALDLPPTTDVDVHVALTTKEQRIYDQMRSELAALLDSGELLEAPNPLAKLMKLRQITAGFLKDTETGDVHIVGESKRKAMTEVACTTLAGKNRVVLFAYFRSDCKMLAEKILSTEKREGRKGTVVEVITGETKSRDRLAIRQRFGDTKKHPERIILVAQARTMSLSVNELVTAQDAIFGSLSERRDDWVQSRDRLNRNGQTKAVTFWNVQVPNTVDEIMLNNHKRRGDMEKALLDHIRATPRRK